MRLTVAALAAAAMLFGVTGHVQAQEGGPSCRPDRDGVVQHLLSKYGEVPVAVAVTSTGALLEVLARPDGSTWSVLITLPDRSATCIVSSGDNWRSVSAAVPGQDS